MKYVTVKRAKEREDEEHPEIISEVLPSEVLFLICISMTYLWRITSVRGKLDVTINKAM